MQSPSSTELLTEAPAGRHFAQMHKDAQALAEAVGVFVETGLRRGDAVIIVVPSSHTPLYLQRLKCNNIDLENWRRSGQLTVLDSQEMLGRFMRGDMPIWEEFRAAVGQIIENARMSGRTTTRVYGEMVSDLWRAGHTAAAIRLEEYWNELARQYQFCLFCGYQVDGLEATSYADPLAEIGRTHSDMLITQEDERFCAALDTASQDVLGIQISRMLTCGGCDDSAGEQRLSIGHQTMLWLQRNMPTEMAKVLQRARQIYADELNAVPHRHKTSASGI